MSISIAIELAPMAQREFSSVAFDVMREIFTLRNELGCLFDERVYQCALAARVENLLTEVRIDVTFQNFCKSYFMDVVVSGGAVFELKTVGTLNDRHRSQLLNYLLLTGLHHGKLVNLRSERIEHEFVNTNLTRENTTQFTVDDSRWQETVGFGLAQKALVLEMLRDWGTCLERALYEEAIMHFLEGSEPAFTEINVCLRGAPVARQNAVLCAPDVAFRITAFEAISSAFEEHLHRYLNSTKLNGIQWLNISRNQVTFRTLCR